MATRYSAFAGPVSVLLTNEATVCDLLNLLLDLDEKIKSFPARIVTKPLGEWYTDLCNCNENVQELREQIVGDCELCLPDIVTLS